MADKIVLTNVDGSRIEAWRVTLSEHVQDGVPGTFIAATSEGEYTGPIAGTSFTLEVETASAVPAVAPDSTDPMGGGHDLIPPDVTTTVDTGVGGTEATFSAEA